MRFIIMHKNDPHTEAGELPPPELIAQMGAFIGEYAQKGQFVDGAGLGASKTRTRLTFRGGRVTVKHGPYAGETELPNAIHLLVVASREQAIGWAERYGKILGDGEIELGPVNEPWDLGLMPKPEGAPLRLLLIEKADADSEAGRRSPKQKAELTRLCTEMTKAGVLVSSQHLEPSARSKRLVFANHKPFAPDGPCSGPKEPVGGFAIMRPQYRAEASGMVKRPAAILGGTLEIDVRPLVDAA